MIRIPPFIRFWGDRLDPPEVQDDDLGGIEPPGFHGPPQIDDGVPDGLVAQPECTPLGRNQPAGA